MSSSRYCLCIACLVIFVIHLQPFLLSMEVEIQTYNIRGGGGVLPLHGLA